MGNLAISDILVLLAYAGLVVTIGLRVGRRRPETENEYFLGGRSLPLIAVLLSLIATELSAATFVGVPDGAAKSLAWFYLQFGIGSLFARLVLAKVVIPLYHRRRVTTVYQLIGERFGERARRATAWTFVVGRWLASSVRLFIAGTAFATVVGISPEVAIAGCGLLAALYAVIGGIRAVIWTDVCQGVVLIAAASALLIAVGGATPGGWSAILDWAREANAFRVFSTERAVVDGVPQSWFWTALTTSTFSVTALLGGFFLTLATHSTDHDMVQRLLTTESGRQGGAALAWSGGLQFPVVIVFLLLGTSLAAWSVLTGTEVDGKILPVFARDQLTAPWRGIVLAGLFAAAMSSLDSAICAIAATWSVDIRGSRESGASTEPRSMKISAWLIAGCLILGAIGFATYQDRVTDPTLSLVELALSAMAIVYGGLLGVFAVGILSERGTSRSATAGLIVGGVVGALLFLQKLILGEVIIAWTWWIPIGAIFSAAVTLAVPAKEREATDALRG